MRGPSGPPEDGVLRRNSLEGVPQDYREQAGASKCGLSYILFCADFVTSESEDIKPWRTRYTWGTFFVVVVLYPFFAVIQGRVFPPKRMFE